MPGQTRTVKTENAPAAIGPYSQAVKAGGWVFCSGQIALDAASGALVGVGDVAAQTARVLDNLEAVLRASGADLLQVVRTTVYLKNMNDFPTVNEVYGRRFTNHPPARVTVEVARLPKDVDVEIDAVAFVGS